MTTSFINRIILIAVLTFSFAANGMAKEPSLTDYNGIEYFTWNIDDNGTLHITPLADITPDFQESPFIKYRKQITSIVFASLTASRALTQQHSKVALLSRTCQRKHPTTSMQTLSFRDAQISRKITTNSFTQCYNIIYRLY